MPFPTTRYSTTDVDTTGNKRPSIETCSYTQIGSLLRSSKCEEWQVCSIHLRQVQCRNLQGFPDKGVAMSPTRQAYGDSFGQCPIPPCDSACTVSEKISPCNKLEFLPPYSPQLAPIERVWKLARRVATHNQYFATLSALVGAVDSCFDLWKKPNRVLQKLCGIN